MRLPHVLIALAFALILGVPLVLRSASSSAVSSMPQGADTIIIITPHVSQLRSEFAAGFQKWYERKTGRKVWVDWRIPGGTSEIIKQLESMYIAALKSGEMTPDGACQPGAIACDLMFGGGSYDHGRLMAGIQTKAAGPDGTSKDVKLSMSVPAGFDKAQLDEWFGENVIGAQNLYDPQQHWIGTAVSSFGIVYNRDVYKSLGLPEPTSFDDLTNPRLAGWIALADPRQSGSIATNFDSILSKKGWDAGWRCLREMSANARYFTNSSTKPPVDVSAGDAAAGLAIDFYGRGQSQAVLSEGQDPSAARVGYVDPTGAVYVDADPASILRGGPRPDLARLFIEFCLSDEGQALWNFPAKEDPRWTQNPTSPEGVKLGPEVYNLRRMPIRRAFYKAYPDAFIDKVDPFKLASDTKSAGWRSAIGPMMGAFGIDNAHEQRAAWRALNDARNDPSFPKESLAEMERLFYSWPTHDFSDGSPTLVFSEKNYKAIREDWKKPGAQARAEIRYGEYFRDAYAKVERIGRERTASLGP